ncbi:MAG TPA: hypothetical protein DCQ31_16565 [Bacteroidales bacterium]|nr:hypothetical protein [Bacteroidales bacterium]
MFGIDKWVLRQFLKWVKLTNAQRTTRLLWTIGITIVLLPTISYFIYRSYQKSYEKAFATNPKVEITEVQFIHSNEKKTVFTKVNGAWLINESYPVKDHLFSDVLYFIQNFDYSEIVPEAESETVAKKLKSDGVLVKVYSGIYKKQSYYIGEEAFGGTGVYMMRENSSQPFVVTVKGYDRSFGVYFHTRDSWYREPFVFPIKEVADINYDWFQTNEEPFAVKKDGSKWIAAWKNASAQASQLQVQQIFESFKTVRYSGLYFDSYDILTNPKIADVKVNYETGENITVSVFKYMQIDTLGSYYFNADTSLIISSSHDTPLLISNIELQKFLKRRPDFL